MAGSSKKIFDALIWTYLRTIISVIYGFISVPLLLEYFGKEEYGLITLATSLNVYLQLMDIGFSGTTVRYFANWLAKKEYKKVNDLFTTTLSFLGFVGILNAIILIIFSFFSQTLFSLNNEQDQILKQLIYILSANAIISWFTSVFDQLIRSSENIMWLQKRALFPVLCQILILYSTIHFKLSLSLYFFLLTFSYLLILPLTVYKLRTILPQISFIPKFKIAIFKEIIGYSISIFSFGIFQFSMLNLRPIILGIQTNVGTVTDYKILDGITGMVLAISGCFFSVILPSSSKVVAENNVKAQNKITYQGTLYITLLLSLLIFGGITIGGELLDLYVGESYHYLYIWLCIWLISLFIQHNQAISTLVFAHTEVKPIAVMSAISTVIGLSSCWFLTQILGLGGIVLGYLLYGICQTLFYYCYYWPKYLHIDSLRVFYKSFLPPILLGGFSFLLVSQVFSCFSLDIVYMFFLKGSIFVCIYILLAFYFILESTDRQFFLNLITKK